MSNFYKNLHLYISITFLPTCVIAMHFIFTFYNHHTTLLFLLKVSYLFKKSLLHISKYKHIKKYQSLPIGIFKAIPMCLQHCYCQYKSDYPNLNFFFHLADLVSKVINVTTVFKNATWLREFKGWFPEDRSSSLPWDRQKYVFSSFHNSKGHILNYVKLEIETWTQWLPHLYKFFI